MRKRKVGVIQHQDHLRQVFEKGAICVYPMVMHENLPIHVQNANKLYAISIWLSYALNAFEKNLYSRKNCLKT